MDNPNFWFFLVLAGLNYIYVTVNKDDGVIKGLCLFTCIICLLQAIECILY